MAIARVQHVTGPVTTITSAGGNVTATFSAAQAGNFLLAYLIFDTNTGAVPTGPSGYAAPQGSGLTFYAHKVAVGGETSATFALPSASACSAYVGVVEYSGVHSPVNLLSGGGGTSTPVMSPRGTGVLCITVGGAAGAGLSAPSWSGTAGESEVDSVGMTTGLGSFADVLEVSGSGLTASLSVTGTPTLKTYVFQSFASATNIALVGSAGAVSNAAAATVTPAFGQATTAGNLLRARVQAHVGSATGLTIATTSTGWSIAVQGNNLGIATGSVAAIAYKANCGAGESAPTFTCTGATAMQADLAEFSGAATASPLDATDSTTGSLTTGVANALVVVCEATSWTKSCTVTTTDSWSGTGTTVAAQGLTATKQLTHSWGSDRLTTVASGTSVSDGITDTPSTGALSDTVDVYASFKPAVAVPASRPPDLLVANFSALTRASTW